MKPYDLNRVFPAWHSDPATFGQLKVLRFFGIDISQPSTEGMASRIITRIFCDPGNKHLWTAYVYVTGDEEHISTELRPHNKASLATVVIPTDWRPKRLPGTPSQAKKLLEELVADIMKDGSPFDDPLPDIIVSGTSFCFTGEFEFGTRKECQEAVVSK